MRRAIEDGEGEGRKLGRSVWGEPVFQATLTRRVIRAFWVRVAFFTLGAIGFVALGVLWENPYWFFGAGLLVLLSLVGFLLLRASRPPLTIYPDRIEVQAGLRLVLPFSEAQGLRYRRGIGVGLDRWLPTGERELFEIPWKAIDEPPAVVLPIIVQLLRRADRKILAEDHGVPPDMLALVDIED